MRRRGSVKLRRKKKESRFKMALARINVLAMAFVRIVLITATLTISTAGAYMGYEKVTTTDYFKIDDVEISGLNMVSKLDVERLMGRTKGKNVFEFDLKEAGKRIESHPWIESVEIRRRLPATIRVFAKERRPVLVIVASRWLLIDRHGVVLRQIGKDENHPYPLITGLSIGDKELQPGYQIDPRRIKDALVAIDRLAGYRLFGKSRLKSVDLSDKSRVDLRFEGSNVIITAHRMGWSDATERLKTVDYILRGREKAVVRIDLSFPDKVIVTYPTKT